MKENKDINLEELSSGIVYDTMRKLGLRHDEFLISPSIRPLNHEQFCYGPVFTNRGQQVTTQEDYASLKGIHIEMYRYIQPGSIVVLEANDNFVAHSGDITCLIYKKLGVSGFITDGIVRDSNRIIKDKFPCFCLGTNPIEGLDYWAITEYEVPIFLPGLHNKISIEPGDYIYADQDGVIRIPKELLQDFESSLLVLLYKEEKFRDAINAAQSSEQVNSVVNSIFAKEGRW